MTAIRSHVLGLAFRLCLVLSTRTVRAQFATSFASAGTAVASAGGVTAVAQVPQLGFRIGLGFNNNNNNWQQQPNPFNNFQNFNQAVSWTNTGNQWNAGWNGGGNSDWNGGGSQQSSGWGSWQTAGHRRNPPVWNPWNAGGRQPNPGWGNGNHRGERPPPAGWNMGNRPAPTGWGLGNRYPPAPPAPQPPPNNNEEREPQQPSDWPPYYPPSDDQNSNNPSANPNTPILPTPGRDTVPLPTPQPTHDSLIIGRNPPPQIISPTPPANSGDTLIIGTNRPPLVPPQQQQEPIPTPAPSPLIRSHEQSQLRHFIYPSSPQYVHVPNDEDLEQLIDVRR